MHADFFHTHLSVTPVIAILRGLDPQRTVDTARACWDIGIRLVEVPLQDEDALRSFEAAAVHADDDARLLGGGTVRTADDVARAHEAGARFLVCPGIFPDTIEAAAAADLPILPGVATPTEVELARRLGCSVQKFFPAGVIGPRAISALLGPYPEVALVAVGAIRAQETASYLAAGALGVGLGSALADPGALAHLTETLTHLRRDHP